MEDDLETLRLFNEKVDRIDRSGLAKRYAEDIPQVIAKFDAPVFKKGNEPGVFTIEGRITSEIADFDEDEIDVFVLTYRMLTQANDRLSIRSLARIYERDWMPEEARAPFADARHKLNDYLATPATVMFGEHWISVGGIADVMIYGGLAHSNERKSAIYRAWMASGVSGFIWAEFLAYAREMIDYFRYFRSLNRAVLEAVDRGVIARPTTPAPNEGID